MVKVENNVHYALNQKLYTYLAIYVPVRRWTFSHKRNGKYPLVTLTMHIYRAENRTRRIHIIGYSKQRTICLTYDPVSCSTFHVLFSFIYLIYLLIFHYFIFARKFEIASVCMVWWASERACVSVSNRALSGKQWALNNNLLRAHCSDNFQWRKLNCSLKRYELIKTINAERLLMNIRSENRWMWFFFFPAAFNVAFTTPDRTE